MDTGTILVVDDDRSMSFFLAQLMGKEGHRVLSAYDGPEALEVLEKEKPDVVLLDVRLPGMDGLEVLRRAKEAGCRAQFIVITAFDAREVGVEAIKRGAYDYFPKPLDKDEVRIVVRRALHMKRLEEENIRLKGGAGRARYGRLIGESPAMHRLYDHLEMLLETDVTVMITGESGTGKELVAEVLHYMGPRKDGPFVKINCVAIPDTLLESELFGHEKGAFTGAEQRKIGRFERAHGGSLFLDEIGDMGLLTQAKLLRFLQERTVERLGGGGTIPVDVRIIAATNKDLERAVREGSFREDLYYRLNVVHLHLPPLRERREDIPLLVDHFVEHYCRLFRKGPLEVPSRTMDLLIRYHWPGNVREMENVIQRGVVMSRGKALEPAVLAPAVLEPEDELLEASLTTEEDLTLQDQVERAVERLERRLIKRALERTGWRRQKAAKLLGISRKTLHNKMAKFRLGERR